MTTRSAAACVARSEKLGAAPTEEARWLLQRLAASESRREKAELRLRMGMALESSAGVASAAEGAREDLGSRRPPPRRMPAADLELGLLGGFGMKRRQGNG